MKDITNRSKRLAKFQIYNAIIKSTELSILALKNSDILQIHMFNNQVLLVQRFIGSFVRNDVQSDYLFVIKETPALILASCNSRKVLSN